MEKENRMGYKTECDMTESGREESHRAKSDGVENGREGAQKQKMEAMRLFGALSGVDEDYLAACEADIGEKKAYPTVCEADAGEKKAYLNALEADAGVSASAVESRKGGQSPAWKMTRFGRRYGVVAAALFCAALFGTGYYFRHSVAPKTNRASGNSDVAAEGTFLYSAVGGNALYDGDVENGATSVREAAGDLVPELPETAKDTDGMPGEATDENGMKSVPDAEEKRNVGEAENEEATKEKTEPESVVDMGLQGGAMETLTLEEARQIAVAGAYLPETWPSSGKLESITATDTAGSERICVTWVYGNGWDSFFLTVRNLGKTVSQEIQEAIADVARPETYDVRLYEIPYADSVPEEYRAIFLDPVFRREDFGKACVEARIKAYAGDSGDTGTPRGNFRVLYQSEEGDYVLVDFNGRGSVEEIRSMINSVDYFTRYEEWMKPEMP